MKVVACSFEEFPAKAEALAVEAKSDRVTDADLESSFLRI